MNAKLELYRRYYCVERNINDFSVLTEWATAYLIQQEYEDNIYELALAKNRKEALFYTSFLFQFRSYLVAYQLPQHSYDQSYYY